MAIVSESLIEFTAFHTIRQLNEHFYIVIRQVMVLVTQQRTELAFSDMKISRPV